MATNPYAKYAQSSGRGVVISDPYREAEEARKAEDQEIERQRLGVSQQGADIAAQNAAIAAEKAERDRREWNATHLPDGTPKPKVEPKPVNPDRIPQLESMLANIKRVREMADDTLAVGTWSGRVGDWPLVGPALGQNRANIEGALQMIEGDLIQQQIAVLAEANHGKGVATMANSETEARRMAASIANLDPNQSLDEFLAGLDRAEQFYLRQLDRQTEAAGAAPVNMSAAGAGATERAVPIPPEMQAENEAWLRQNLGTASPEDYAKFRQSLDRKYNFEPPPEAGLTSWFEGEQRAVAGGADPKTAIPPASEELSGFDQFRNDVVSNPLGSFVASAANAGGFGLPSLMAGDQYDAMRELNPIASTTGEVAGAITGTLTAGAGLGALGGRAGNETIARLLSNPLTADMAYGGAYGATQADDPLYGAIGGAAAGAAGNVIGGQIAKRLPGMVGIRKPADALAPGERRVFDAVERTGIDPVVDALLNADELGVPASLADVSSDVGSLTGAALRRSPTAAGDARQVLGQRSRGQYDRFLGAVERDLGPVANIPQRSEELISQARTQAGPLYDAAYAAPGAENVVLSDLADRPTFAAALREAYSEALDEGLDPSAVGLQQVGDDIMVASPSWQSLDYVKRGLDNIIDRNTSKIDGATPEARRAIEMKNILVGRMDEANPAYAAARRAYASPMQERAALAAGQDAMRISPNQLGVDFANASPTQQGQMRLGFQSQLGEHAGRGRNNANPFQAILDTPAMEQRLGTLYPEGGENIARLLAQRDLERQLAASTNRLVGNSATAERQVADQAFGDSSLMSDAIPMAVETSLSGAPWATGLRSIASRIGGQAARDRRILGSGARATALADEIAPLALNTNPADAATSLQELAARDAEYQQIIEALLKDARERGGHVGAGVASALLN